MRIKILSLRIFFWALILTFFSNFSFAQTDDVDSMSIFYNRKGKLIQKKGDELYFGVTPGYSMRKLTENPGLFSAPLGERENEVPGWFYSFHLGYRTMLNKSFVLDIGFEFSRSGEFYETTADSVYAYKNSYNYIGIPLQVGYQYGNRMKLHVAGGVVPKMFINHVQTETMPNEFGIVDDVKTTYKEGYNFFNLDAVISAGVRWNASKNIGIYVLPEMRWQLMNTFQKQSPYIHRTSVFGIKAGLNILL